MAKLNWDKVKEIREKYKTKNYTQKMLGIEYNVSPSRISVIINNISWEEVNSD